MILSKEQYAADVMKLAQTDAPFRPFGYYDQDGDFFELIIKPDSYYGDRRDGMVTILKSNENDQLVGIMIKNLRKTLEKLPGFKVSVKNKRVKISCIVQAGIWVAGGSSAIQELEYEEIVQAAGTEEVEIDGILV